MDVKERSVLSFAVIIVSWATERAPEGLRVNRQVDCNVKGRGRPAEAMQPLTHSASHWHSYRSIALAEFLVKAPIMQTPVFRVLGWQSVPADSSHTPASGWEALGVAGMGVSIPTSRKRGGWR